LLVGAVNSVTVGALVVGALGIGSLHFLPRRERDKTDNFIQAQGYFHEATVGGVRVAMEVAWIVPFFALSALALHWLAPGTGVALAVPAGAILFYLFAYERAFVRAGQLPPLS
jgi:hypothetical protein